jgi:hypothetical protein
LIFIVSRDRYVENRNISAIVGGDLYPKVGAPARMPDLLDLLHGDSNTTGRDSREQII